MLSRILLGFFLLSFLSSFYFLLKEAGEERRRLFTGIFLVLIFIFLFPSQVTFLVFENQPVKNFGGVAGYRVSEFLFEQFGFPSFLIPFLFLLGAISFFLRSLRLFFHMSSVLLALFLFLLFAGRQGETGKGVDEFLKNMAGFVRFLVYLFVLFSPVLVFVKKRKERIPPEPEKRKEKKKRERKKRERKKEEKKEEKEIPVEEKSLRDEILSLLHDPVRVEEISKEEAERLGKLIEEKLENFKIRGKIVDYISGPVITRFEYEPAPEIKASSVISRADDVAMAIKAPKVRMSMISGKGAIGIEVPNKRREIVYIKELLTHPEYERDKHPLFIPLGKDITGKPYYERIDGMPHLLVAGATGSGKSVFIHSVITSILFRAGSQDVKFLLVDPKRIELSIYNGIPHLVRPVVVEPREAVEVLKESIEWMEYRYRELGKASVRDIEGYNKKMKEKMPYILIIIDELADLMMVAGREIEHCLVRLAQMARAVGIHLVVATQRPSVNVITGLIKANFPARISFQVVSRADSRTILDEIGAEKLLGKGDMLYRSPRGDELMRLHGAFVSVEEALGIRNLFAGEWLKKLLGGRIDKVNEVVRLIIEEDMIDVISDPGIPGSEERIEAFCRFAENEVGIPAEELKQVLEEVEYYPGIEEMQHVKKERKEGEEGEEEERDPLFEEAKRIVIQYQTASISLLQRKLKIGYARAGRLIDQLEKAGIVGPYRGSKSREVLIKGE